MKAMRKIPVFAGIRSFAQQGPLVNEYMFNQMYLHLAYTGFHSYINASMLFRKQWDNFDGAPSTETASVDCALSDKNMVGLFSLK